MDTFQPAGFMASERLPLGNIAIVTCLVGSVAALSSAGIAVPITQFGFADGWNGREPAAPRAATAAPGSALRIVRANVPAATRTVLAAPQAGIAAMNVFAGPHLVIPGVPSAAAVVPQSAAAIPVFSEAPRPLFAPGSAAMPAPQTQAPSAAALIDPALEGVSAPPAASLAAAPAAAPVVQAAPLSAEAKLAPAVPAVPPVGDAQLVPAAEAATPGVEVGLAVAVQLPPPGEQPRLAAVVEAAPPSAAAKLAVAARPALPVAAVQLAPAAPPVRLINAPELRKFDLRRIASPSKPPPAGFARPAAKAAGSARLGIAGAKDKLVGDVVFHRVSVSVAGSEARAIEVRIGADMKPSIKVGDLLGLVADRMDPASAGRFAAAASAEEYVSLATLRAAGFEVSYNAGTDKISIGAAQ